VIGDRDCVIAAGEPVVDEDERVALVGEVVGRLSLLTEVAQAGDRVVEDELALANQQRAPLGVVGCHVSSSVFLGLGARSDSERD
jgi:hypothetical protein